MDKGGKSKTFYGWKECGGYFERLAGGRVRCTHPKGDGICGHEIGLHTRNMATHLVNEHKFSEDEWILQQRAPKDGLRSWVMAGRVLFSKEELREQQLLLAVAISNSNLPVTIFQKKSPSYLHVGARNDSGVSELEVERYDLHDWLCGLVPQFKTGHYQTLQARLISERRDRLEPDMRFLLKQMMGVAFTTDGFTSEAKLHFHALTAHGVVMLKGQLVFITFLLADTVFASATAAVEAQWFHEQLEHWNIARDQCVGMTVDGAERAMARAVDMAFLWCPLHLLNLGIHDVLQWPKRDGVRVPDAELANYPLFLRGICNVIDKCKQTVGHFASPKQWEALVKVHAQLRLPGEIKTFKQDVVTRWSSELTMMESVSAAVYAKMRSVNALHRRCLPVRPLMISTGATMAMLAAFSRPLIWMRWSR